MTLDDLIAYGADVDAGLSRCMGKEDLYLRLVGSVRDESSFAELRAALDARDLDRAFESAHSLKGVLANLALSPLYEPVNEITELLRAKADADYAQLMDAIEREYERFCAL